MTGLTSGDHVMQIKLIMGNGSFKTMSNIVNLIFFSTNYTLRTEPKTSILFCDILKKVHLQLNNFLCHIFYIEFAKATCSS